MMLQLTRIVAVLACLGGPMALAWLLARAFRLEKYLWRMAVVSYSALFALPMLRFPDSMKLGIDLSGGTILVYEIDQAKKPEQTSDRDIMEKMVAAINRRINPGGLEDVTVRPVGTARLEVIVPGGDPQAVSRYRERITNIGSLEFRILADGRRHADLIEDTQPQGSRPARFPFPEPVRRAADARLTASAAAGQNQLQTERAVPLRTSITINASGSTSETRTVTAVSGGGPYTLTLNESLERAHERDERVRYERVAATWIPVSPEEANKKQIRERALRVLSETSGTPQEQLTPPTPLATLAKGAAGVDGLWNALEARFSRRTGRTRGAEVLNVPPQDRLRIRTVGEALEYVSAALTVGLHGQIAWNIHPEQGLMILVVNAEREDDRITGEYLLRATQEYDTDGSLAVGFVLNTSGAHLFRELTGTYKPESDEFMHRLAILLNDEIQSAPNLKQEIGGAGQISGGFANVNEVQDLITILNAGALPAALVKEPVSEENISPTLGNDTIRMGMRAIVVSMIAVPAFMLVYYWFSGGVANVALLLNLLMTLGVMSLIQANFTMAGLAGLALTVGMAVDANVLIYERIREEQARGATFRMAIRNGFEHARRTIVDSNLTTLITGVVLYWIGTEQVKGFAVTLILGLLLNMYTALYVSRLIFDAFEQKRWVRSFQAFQWIKNPQIDFLGRFLRYTFPASMAIMVVGLAAFFARGVEARENREKAGVGAMSYVLGGHGVRSNLDIDFTGGTAVDVRFGAAVRSDEVRSALRNVLPDLTFEELHRPGEQQAKGASTRFRVRTSEQDFAKVEAGISQAFGDRLVRLRMQFQRLPEATDALSTETGSGGSAPIVEPSIGAAKQAATASADSSKPAAQSAAPRHRWELAFDEAVSEASARELIERQYRAMNLPTTGLSVRGLAPEREPQSTFFHRLELTAESAPETLEQALAAIQTELGQRPFFEQRIIFGGKVAQDTQVQALWAVLLSMAGIIGYLWARFQNVTFGLAAVIALVHDVLITLGMVALCYWLARGPGSLVVAPFKIDLVMISAFLTLIGYSVNDTVVVFDRVREVRGKSPDITREMINLAVNQTLGRTLLTGLSTLMVTIILYVFGGEAIRGFAFCLTIGMITGTYSSVFIASPLLLWLAKQRLFLSYEQRRGVLATRSV